MKHGLFTKTFPILLFTILILAAVTETAISLVAKNIVSPPRKPLEPYHREFLADPSAFGLVIQKRLCTDAKHPVLIVEPHPGRPLSSKGQLLLSQLRESETTFPKLNATIYLLHGRKGRKEDLLPVAERFCALGFRCIIPDLPAHGDSPLLQNRFASTEAERAILPSLRDELQREGEFECLWGMSMGGAFALRAASELQSPWDAVIVINTYDQFDSLLMEQSSTLGASVGRHLYTRIKSKLFHKYHFPTTRSHPSKWAQDITCPTLVVHAEDDELTALERGRRIFQNLDTTRKSFISIPDANHNNVLITDYPLYHAMAAWLLGLASPVTLEQ